MNAVRSTLPPMRAVASLAFALLPISAALAADPGAGVLAQPLGILRRAIETIARLELLVVPIGRGRGRPLQQRLRLFQRKRLKIAD